MSARAALLGAVNALTFHSARVGDFRWRRRPRGVSATRRVRLHSGLLTVAYYFGVFAMAWDLLFGFAGEVNFGPTFLIGVGAYTAGILDNLYQPPIWLCLVAGALAAVLGGVVLALPALRVRGPYFGLTTLVAVLMLQNFIVVAASLTGGEIGLTVPDVISISDTTNYEIALWFMAVSGAILFALSRSPVGLILQASGQDAVQAGALGFNVVKHKLAAFIISAFFSGLAGGLLVFYFGTASVTTLVDITVGVQIIIAAVIGGRRTILGAALGAIFLIAMSELLRPLGEFSNFIGIRAGACGGAGVPRRVLRPAYAHEGKRVTTAGALLDVSGLTKRYGGLVAVKDMALSIPSWQNPWSDRPKRLWQIDGDEAHHGDRAPQRGFSARRWHRSGRLAVAQDRGRRGVGIVFQHSRPLHRQTVLENIKLALFPTSSLVCSPTPKPMPAPAPSRGV